MNTPVTMLIHTHKEYPFNFDSTWAKPCYAASSDPNEWHPSNGNFINVYEGSDTIKRFYKYYSGISELEFLKAMGQQSTEYYAANHIESDYIGCGSYRRYLAIENGVGFIGEKLEVPANEETCRFLTSDSQMNRALEYFKSADVVCSRFRMMNASIENQYLQSQLPEYWFLFKEAIKKLFPEYKKHMLWFTDYSICNYECVYLMPKPLFKKMFNEYFSIMEYIWQNCEEVYPDKNKRSWHCSEPFPWRYPGFLNERFVPFFMYANGLRKIEVPLAFLS